MNPCRLIDPVEIVPYRKQNLFPTSRILYKLARVRKSVTTDFQLLQVFVVHGIYLKKWLATRKTLVKRLKATVTNVRHRITRSKSEIKELLARIEEQKDLTVSVMNLLYITHRESKDE